ncbi:MAG: ABC transporter permease [Gammaproteobacteria bacterium]|nr:ABC transporter permease [Gammaproteobacteria bacterium]
MMALRTIGPDVSGQSSVRAAAVAARRGRWGNLLWLLPVLALYAAGLVLPLGITVRRAFELGAAGWSDLLHNSLFTGAALNTVIDSTGITVVAVLLAYSLAAAIWRGGAIARASLTTLVVIAFLTTVLVKIVAFNALLRDNGVLNTLLQALGVIDGPLHLFPGRPAMIVAMVQYVVPFAIFPILSVMVRLDKRVEQAAESLGASPWHVFVHVVLPLTLPGVIAAALLVFVICTGFYVIPATLGTPRDQLLANVVALYALQLVDFRVASAVAMVLVVVVGVLTVLYQRAERATR